jgi:hypothetical protein
VHSITGPQADLNLGLKTFLNGALVSNIVLDTSAAATDTIHYVATLPAQAGDPAGLTSTSTRTVLIDTATSASAPAASSTTDATSSLAVVEAPPLVPDYPATTTVQ